MRVISEHMPAKNIYKLVTSAFAVGVTLRANERVHGGQGLDDLGLGCLYLAETVA